MRAKYLVGAGAVVLVVAIAGFSASTSPVADAAASGDLVAVQTLIKQKADVNAPQADGATAIQWAAYRNDSKMADALIAAGANVTLTNHDGATPLYLASLNGNAAMIEKLLKGGADANEKEVSGATALMFAARNGNPEAVRVLLDHKADANAKDKIRGTTPLMWAAEQSHPAAMKVLIAGGADVSAASSNDSKGARAYLAPTVQQRQNSAQGAGGIGQGGGRGGRGGRGGQAAAPGQGPTQGTVAAGGAQVATAGAPAAGRGRGARGGRGAAPAAGATGDGAEEDVVAAADAQAAAQSFGRQSDTDGGGLTALVLSARENCQECAQILLDSKADVNQRTHYGWTALLTATQNRHYKLGQFLLEHGANPNLPNNGGWNALYLATDNRNIEGGDYPVRKPDMDHLEFIKALLDKGANVNARVCGVSSTPTNCAGDSTETRTNFTMQWLREDGATPFLRAAQSGDVDLMKLLIAHGADPKIATQNNVTALSVAAGIGWVEGVTYEWSPEQNLQAVKMCLDLGIDPNAADVEGRTALHGAAHKGRNDVILLLVDRGAKLDVHDKGSRDTVNGDMRGITWEPLNYAQGLVRVGVQSAIPHPETAALIKKLMDDRHLEIPPDITSSICLTKGLKGCQ